MLSGIVLISLKTSVIADDAGRIEIQSDSVKPNLKRFFNLVFETVPACNYFKKMTKHKIGKGLA